MTSSDDETRDPQRVFVIHGRNLRLRDAVSAFLHSLRLRPLSFEDAAEDLRARTSAQAPLYIGDIIRHGIARAQAVIAIVACEECMFLNPNVDAKAELGARMGARANVWFEAGIAFQLAPGRLLLAREPGAEIPTDYGGVLYYSLTDTLDARRNLRRALQTVGCQIDEHSDDWREPAKAGKFDSAAAIWPAVRNPWV